MIIGVRLPLRVRLFGPALRRLRPAALATHLKQLLRIKRVIVPTDVGSFFVDPVSHLGDSLIRDGRYEPNMEAALRRHLRPGGTFVDVGANEGYFSVLGGRIVGPGGRGAVAAWGLEGRVGVVMGTLSKALGAAGGFVAGSADLCAYLRNRARSFIFDTALPPPTAAAAAAALGVIEREPERPVRARRLAGGLATGLRAAGYAVVDPAAAVLPVLIGSPDAALGLSARLLEAGVLVTAIRPPSVPEGTSRLRATVMATHTDAEIDRAVAAFAAARG